MAKISKGQGGKEFWEPSKLESFSVEALQARAGGYVTWAAVLTGMSAFANNHDG
jgi:hypothetical protein